MVHKRNLCYNLNFKVSTPGNTAQDASTIFLVVYTNCEIEIHMHNKRVYGYGTGLKRWFVYTVQYIYTAWTHFGRPTHTQWFLLSLIDKSRAGV